MVLIVFKGIENNKGQVIKWTFFLALEVDDAAREDLVLVLDDDHL